MRRIVIFALVLSFILATVAVAWAETMSSDDSDMMDMGASKEEPKREAKEEMKSKTETMNPDGTMTIKAMDYTLVLDAPKAVDKGKSSTIVLEVRKENKPVTGLVPHMMIKSMYAQEDGHESKDDMGDNMDMGQNVGMGDKKSNLDIKGRSAGSGVYRFKWTPDVDGPFELSFMLDDKQMKDDAGMKKDGSMQDGEKPKKGDEVTVPVYVKPIPANPYVLGAFALFVITVLSYSSVLRRQQKLGGLAHELA